MDCLPENPRCTLTLEEIFRELFLPCGKPVLAGVACGHALPTMCLPLGATARMDANRKTREVF